MNACDVIAYTHDGAVYCTDCVHDEPDNEEQGVVFADDSGWVGSTCDACQCFLGPDLEWHPYADVNTFRWVTCARCNHQEPMENRLRDRHLAMRGQHRCPNCGGSLHA